MSITDIAATTPPPEHEPRRGSHPTGFDPIGITYTAEGRPESAVLASKAPLAAPEHRAKIEEQTRLPLPADLDVQVERLTIQNDADGNPVQWWYKYRFVPRARTDADIDALVRAAKRRAKTAPSVVTDTSTAFVIALGDLQLGKMDGDGIEGTVARFLDTTKQAVARYKRIAKGAPVYLIHLGDCIEGFQSQGGANAWRTPITTTEQVRHYRRLVLEQVKAFAAVAPQVVVVGIPGNHDEAHRPLHTYGDSWAIEVMSQVHDALELAGGYDHVKIHAPARDELTLTLDVCGTVVGMAHGHQWRAGQAVNWWAKQSHGRQPVGDADLLLSAHLHHLRIEHTGSDKTWMQVPALESGSQWWKHRTGEWGQPGVLTMLVGGGSWSALEVLSCD